MVHNFKKLKVWEKDKDIAVAVYQFGDLLPNHEKYGLFSQITRSAVSLSSNIAEGAGRNSEKQFLYFLQVAQGSSYELESQLLILHEIYPALEEKARLLLADVGEFQKMIFTLIKKQNSQLES